MEDKDALMAVSIRMDIEIMQFKRMLSSPATRGLKQYAAKEIELLRDLIADLNRIFANLP